ncbi:hypothetical protein [Pseudonocardia endophytica]|uniref:Secreted protein n=1 Tax=Pseudonocardia endophytica TaxID=401976 RepID=A0A4R1HFK7_PSEEN|nr:hypothetical protein [Pseudonocardia endophytica]TCK20907.1 hypothetical protein EV378_4873 [Pseudonocardia endophytica]
MRNIKRSLAIGLIGLPLAVGAPAMAFAGPLDFPVANAPVLSGPVEQDQDFDFDQDQDNETDQSNSNSLLPGFPAFPTSASTGPGGYDEWSGHPHAQGGGVDQDNRNATEQGQKGKQDARGDQRVDAQDKSRDALPPVPFLD